MTHGENMKKIKSFFENLSVKWRIAAGIGCLAIAAILGYTALSLQNVQLYARGGCNDNSVIDQSPDHSSGSPFDQPDNARHNDSSEAKSKHVGEFLKMNDYDFNFCSDCRVEGISLRLDAWLDNEQTSADLEASLSWDGGTNWTAAKPLHLTNHL